MFILFALLLILLAMGALDEMLYADGQQTSRPPRGNAEPRR